MLLRASGIQTILSNSLILFLFCYFCLVLPNSLNLNVQLHQTLLDVLERRQSDPYSTVTPAHRRHRTYVGDIPNTFQSPNYNLDMTRPNSAPDSTDVMRGRPGLISRSSSYRSSRRNSGNISGGATSNLNDYLGVSGDGVSVSPIDDITKPDTIKPAISDSAVSPSRPNSADAAHASPSRSKFGWNSFRRRTS